MATNTRGLQQKNAHIGDNMCHLEKFWPYPSFDPLSSDKETHSRPPSPLPFSFVRPCRIEIKSYMIYDPEEREKRQTN